MRHDYVLLTVGLLRSASYVVGIFYSIRFHRWLIAAGFSLGVVSSGIFAFLNAGFQVEHSLVDSAAYIGSLSTASIICGFILGTHLYARHRHWSP